MGLIKNLARYVIKQIPVADDFVTGSDSENNGKTVSYRLGDLLAGDGSIVQNNRFKEIDFVYSTEADLFNTINNLVDNTTDYKTVLEDQIPIFTGLIGADLGSAVEKCYLVLNNGKGIYGENGNVVLTDSDLKEFGSSTSSGTLTLTEDVTATLQALGIDEGDTVPLGTSFTDFVKLLISPTILATVEQVQSLSVSGVSTQVLEIGQVFSDTLSYIFNRGVIDNKDRVVDTDLVGAELSNSFIGNGIDTSGNINTPILAGSNQWGVQLNYGLGVNPYYDSDGNTGSYLDAFRNAGVLIENSNVVTGRYKYWFDVGAENSTANDSASIRGLSDDGFASSITFNITIPANNKEVAFYIPDTFNVQSVLFVESSNADVTSTFVSSNIPVLDAGGASVGYNKYTAVIGGTGYPTLATYSVTIN